MHNPVSNSTPLSDGLRNMVVRAVSRRSLLKGLTGAGAAAFLSGCAGTRRISQDFPGPVWPHEEPSPVINTQPPATISQAPAPQVPAPRPTQAPGPVQVIPRSAWTRAQPKWQYSKPMNGVQRITVHHDAINTRGERGQSFAVERLNTVRRGHLDRGPTWVDIGYHYVIDPDGRVWEGRPIRVEGAHVAETNDHNLGIMLMGNFEEQRPTSQQLSALDQFLAQQMRQYRVPMGRVYTHKELKPTECPGEHLQAYMGQTRGSRGRLARMG
jgi:hypothetical protein